MTVMAGDRVAAADKRIRDLLSIRPSTSGGIGVALPVPEEGGATGVMEIRVNEEALTKGERRIRSLTSAGSERVATLSLLLTWTPALTFEELASLVNVRPERLESWLHGRESIPAGKAERLLHVARILSNLAKVLDRAATRQWLEVSIPDLGGETPADYFRRGRLQQLVQLTESYLDPSFG